MNADRKRELLGRYDVGGELSLYYCNENEDVFEDVPICFTDCKGCPDEGEPLYERVYAPYKSGVELTRPMFIATNVGADTIYYSEIMSEAYEKKGRIILDVKRPLLVGSLVSIGKDCIVNYIITKREKKRTAKGYYTIQLKRADGTEATYADAVAVNKNKRLNVEAFLYTKDD